MNQINEININYDEIYDRNIQIINEDYFEKVINQYIVDHLFHEHIDDDPDEIEGGPKTIFHLACINNSIRTIKLILNDPKFNVILNAADDSNFTGFMMACFYNNIEIVMLLLHDSRIDVNIFAFQATPLVLACNCNNLEMVKLLLGTERINSNNNVDNNGWSIFHHICMNCSSINRIQILKLLLDDKRLTNYNCQDRLNKMTPLHMICMFKNGDDNDINIIKILLGDERILPSLKIVSNYGTPLEIVEKQNHNSELVKLLKYYS